MDDNTNRMRLEGNQRQSGADRVTEPETKRDREMERRWFGLRWKGRIYIPVTDHLIVSIPLIGRNREFSPDVQPFPGVFVYLLFTDFYTDIVDQSIADIIHPPIGGVRRIRLPREIHLNEQRRQKIGVTGNNCGYTLSEIGVAVKINRHRFHRERCVTTIDVFEECKLRVTRQIGVLAPARNEL